MTKKAAIYTRVSTEDQAKDGFSLASQLDRLRAYCKVQGWDVAEEYVDDGHSGRNTKRPQYQRMMDEREKWDILLVVKMDRLHRNSRNFLDMMDILKAEGKDFASATENLDTSTAMGRFIAGVIQQIAQLESEQIGERVFDGMKQMATEGGRPGARAPYGYLLKDGELVPNENASVVSTIFTLHSRGHTCEAIANSLNAKSIPSPRGGKWHRQVIHKILNNPTYRGRVRWGDVESKGKHRAIIT